MPSAQSLLTASSSPPTPIFLLGISGPASTGKTTLAHLLSHIFTPHIPLIIHEDDFCKELDQIPVRNGYVDADSPDAVDFQKLCETLDHLKANQGQLPPGFHSWQADVFGDQKSRALAMVSEDPELVEQLREKVSARLLPSDTRYLIVILEGFLLYHREDVRRLLDGKLFVRLDWSEARRRRMTRPGYGAEAKEGEFWKTEDYFEKMVWRNYVEQHRELFEEGDVEGPVDRDVCRQRGIVVQEAMNVEVGQTLSWAVDELVSLLKVYTG